MEKSIVSLKYESDGQCFGLITVGKSKVCDVMAEPAAKVCGTYLCPFYKPVECKDWIRRDKGMSVVMIPPENVRKEEYYG